MKWGVINEDPRHPRRPKANNQVADPNSHRLTKYYSPAKAKAKSYAISLAKNLTKLVPPIFIGMMVHDGIKAVSDIRKRYDRKDYTKEQGEYEDLKKLKKKTSQLSDEEDLKMVNPDRRKKGSVNNCGFCTVSTEMRARGYDVQARKKASGISVNQFAEWFDGVKNIKAGTQRNKGESRKNYVNRAYDSLCKSIEKNGNGSRGYIALCYDGFAGSGHVFNWQVKNGKVVFMDGQSGTTTNSKEMQKVFSFADPSSYEYARLDNCKVNKRVTEACISSPDTEKRGKK